MYTDFDKKIMLKFLSRNYPVTRFKHGHRFKRAIVLDSGSVCFLNDENSNTRLRVELINTLEQIFNCDILIITAVLDSFLPIKR